MNFGFRAKRAFRDAWKMLAAKGKVLILSLKRTKFQVLLRSVGLWYNFVMEPFHSNHSRVDERSLALHALVAQKVQAAPALLDRARENICRWQQANGSPSLALAEWERILNSPVDQVTAFLVERSERATRLRQSSPFAGILTEAERRAIYESYST
ncbi:MAG TPA: hypothetical protein VIF02_12355 [Methylocella sp.]